MNTKETIEKKLSEAFSPVHLEVIDESEQHRGHGGYREGVATHFHVHIRASAFSGKSRVAAQRLVYSVLKAELDGDVHALALKVES
ncbi:BolA family protein [Algicella marina]|uniref:BolA/IbaG family iron-sulfur metabolism protein n=1 Tax=Algicella marina TaxID=2683284 RepID=A0A6P1T0Q4_9RHOB|nr:BolA family protein [Algicella marina]QHQ34102.1 BolA/IbaG family iron-sulfur metabolism protein [Algicella marina]